ncbi:Glutamate 5-kinase [hydrothermal vent metagenome]|uniref:Glutamate 5-kinase n=1 Tax=hydrothermal vent metagenome TaxID=652676 RepID=A0A1W1C7M7_9ZZZZ
MKSNKRVVIKVGSHVLTEHDETSNRMVIAKKRMIALVELISKLKLSNYDVILVSSGAVSAGATKLDIDKKIIRNKQALASIGQPLLMLMYQEKFSKYNILCSQILISADDLDSRKQTAHAKGAIDRLLELNIVPIINENDATATEELVFGDNDRLSAHVSYYFNADMLVILSDIDAYYNKDPHKYSDAVINKIVNKIDPEELEADHTPNNVFATGGIVTKLESADFLLKHNKEMFLASGFDLSDISSFLIDNIHKGGTLFKS